MDLPEPLKYVSVPLRLSVWQQLRLFAAADRKAMSELCAQWIRQQISARAAERGGQLSAAADDSAPAA